MRASSSPSVSNSLVPDFTFRYFGARFTAAFKLAFAEPGRSGCRQSSRWSNDCRVSLHCVRGLHKELMLRDFRVDLALVGIGMVQHDRRLELVIAVLIHEHIHIVRSAVGQDG
jgi:hypothetical protein